MIVQQDTREKTKKHDFVLKVFEQNQIKVVRSKLYVGDYTRLDNQTICIDTKQDLQELYSNVILSNTRFKTECTKAMAAGIQLIILTADDEIASVADVHKWKNPRREKWFMVSNAQQRGKMLRYKIATKPPASSDQLQKALETMSERYGVQFLFCPKQNVGEKIIELLK